MSASGRMRAVYYRSPNGQYPARAFIASPPSDVRASLDNQIARLNMLFESDPPLPFPHSSQVDGELRELRAHHGRLLFRILYRRSRNLFVLLHACSKFS